jgi:hypothetical protein
MRAVDRDGMVDRDATAVMAADPERQGPQIPWVAKRVEVASEHEGWSRLETIDGDGCEPQRGGPDYRTESASWCAKPDDPGA